MKPEIDIGAQFIFSDEEALASNNEPPDPLRKFFEPSTSANVEEKFLKVHQADSPLFATARPVVKSTAAPSSEWDLPVATSDTLTKRFADGLVLSGYRNWFRSELAKGKSAQQTLDSWLSANPQASAEVVDSLRAVCAEF